MNFVQRVSSIVKKHIASIEAAYDRRVAEAEVRARHKLDRARTKQERELAMLQLRRDKATLRKELSEAKVATYKAETAAKKARREAGDLTVGERLGAVGSRLGRETVGVYRALEKAQRPKRRRTTRKVTKRR